MKKKIAFFCALLLLALATAIPACAFLGSGGQVLAREVSMIKTGLLGEKMTFKDTDFKTTLGVSDFNKIEITSIPSSTEGTLMLGSRRVGVGQAIKRKNIAALSFIPATKNVTECKFSFTCDDYNGGKEIPCTLKFIDKVNYAPTIDEEEAASLDVWTQCGVSSYGKLLATDPEGDACEYIILSYPKKATLSLLDKTTGAYKYTPSEDFTGNDEFCYVVRDSYGNYSTPETVSVKVAKRQSNTTYVDMVNSPAENAALVMDAKGIMSGTLLGDHMYFSPEKEVTRAEFTAMAMKCAGIRPDSSLTSTFFDDNAQIPAALMSYVATAQRLGIVNGAFDGKALNFRPNDSITALEAAIILASLTKKVEVDTTVMLSYAETVPVWARADVHTMLSLGIFKKDTDLAALSTPLDRAAVAEILFAFISV